jgi:hypothetical protein
MCSYFDEPNFGQAFFPSNYLAQLHKNTPIQHPQCMVDDCEDSVGKDKVRQEVESKMHPIVHNCLNF